MSAGPSVAKQVHEAPDKNALVNLHVAEYEALMTRNTYWLTIQFSTAPAIAIYFTLLATAWSTIGIVQPVRAIALQKSILWIGILGAELFVIAGYMCLYEIYNNVRYVESHLRPVIEALMPGCDFWMYEKFLAKHRGFGALANEWWAIGLTLGAFVVIAFRSRPWDAMDFLCFLGGIIVAAVMVARGVEISKMRLRAFRD
ncbi:MAG TPA: hypothetical protein VGH51_05790 [Candidatus Angelobacter sp.]|jgi:hypothetical protein